MPTILCEVRYLPFDTEEGAYLLDIISGPSQGRGFLPESFHPLFRDVPRDGTKVEILLRAERTEAEN